jgi:phosphoribosylaminoimidazole-succinocarboxamide synthase
MQDRFTAKRLTVIEEAKPGATGVGEFEFTDHYSVFDFGIMPDPLPGKGAAMCEMAAFNLELLEAAGIPTHFRRKVDANRLQFDLMNVYDPIAEYIAPGSRCYFVPLQVVFRNSLPAGASLLRRFAAGSAHPEDYGWNEVPACGEPLPSPVIEYMTKLEDLDRFIARSRAQELSVLSDLQVSRIEELVLATNRVLDTRAREVGLELADAKVEFGIDGFGDPVVVDVAGTPDETRLLLDGHHVSKQVLRVANSRNDLRRRVHEWANDGRDPDTKPVPDRLSPDVVSTVSLMYRSVVDRWVGKAPSASDAPLLEDLLPELIRIQTPSDTEHDDKRGRS